MKRYAHWTGCIILAIVAATVAGNQSNRESDAQLKGESDAQCRAELDKQKELRKASLAPLNPQKLAESSQLGDLANDSQLKKVWEIWYSFDKAKFKGSTYTCSKSREVEYRKHFGMSYLVDITEFEDAEIFDVRQVLFDQVQRHPDRYRLTHDFLIDVKNARELQVSSTIDFVLANTEVFFPNFVTRTPRAIVSGPYWKYSEYGEKVIGLLKRPADEHKPSQGYLPHFRARHILCAMKTGIDLISPRLLRPGDNPDELKEQMERLTTGCDSAIQIGPAYFERDVERNKVGIAGLSRAQARRNILVRALGHDNSEKTYLWTGRRPISPFDAMVLIEAIIDELVGENSILWAAGLSDDEFQSGPAIILNDGTSYPLAPTDPPVGALLVLYGPEVP